MTITTTDTPEAEAGRVAFDRQSLDLRTATPCIVVAVSADGTTVDVTPAISMTRRVEGAQELKLPSINGVPIAMYGSTSLGLFVVPPISKGDEGILVISDRALDNWQFGEGVSVAPDAASPRHHDITDAMFYPGVQRSSGAIEGMPTDAIQLRNRDGDCKLSVSNTVINGIAPGGAAINLAAGSATLTGSAGSISAGAAGVSIIGPLSINGKPYTGHNHPVTSAPGNTGGVNP